MNLELLEEARRYPAKRKVMKRRREDREDVEESQDYREKVRS